MKRKLLITILIILLLTAGSVSAGPKPDNDFDCDYNQTCAVDVWAGSTTVITRLSSCQVIDSPPYVFIMCAPNNP